MKTLTITILALFWTNLALAGGNGSGGGQPADLSYSSVSLDITSLSLKNSMMSYLANMDMAKVGDPNYGGSPQILETFTRILKDGALLKDIETPKNYYIGKNCRDAFDNKVPASTKLGTQDQNGKLLPNIGGGVCFDASQLTIIYQQKKGLTEEQLMIELAALAFHEHVHHFQIFDSDPAQIKKNEDEANLIAGYIRNTARDGQVVVLTWAPNTPLLTPESQSLRNFGCETRVDYLNGQGVNGILTQSLSIKDDGQNYEFVFQTVDQDNFAHLKQAAQIGSFDISKLDMSDSGILTLSWVIAKDQCHLVEIKSAAPLLRCGEDGGNVQPETLKITDRAGRTVTTRQFMSYETRMATATDSVYGTDEVTYLTTVGIGYNSLNAKFGLNFSRMSSEGLNDDCRLNADENTVEVPAQPTPLRGADAAAMAGILGRAGIRAIWSATIGEAAAVDLHCSGVNFADTCRATFADARPKANPLPIKSSDTQQFWKLLIQAGFKNRPGTDGSVVPKFVIDAARVECSLSTDETQDICKFE